VPAVIDSAFIYAGQKCSAAARVLAHEAIAEPLLERLAGNVRTLLVGQADTFGTEVPPVIEREAQERLARFAEHAERDGRIVARVEEGVPSDGWFVAPALAADLARTRRSSTRRSSARC
jgi:RHH-type proline utilization regulon transcriptional repressor/proline dehydrogenase/delta 1-pyrroline-5-carboxylate dehydrogenase